MRALWAAAAILLLAIGFPAIRKEAFFWLAQSKDPEALKYLDKVLNDD